MPEGYSSIADFKIVIDTSTEKLHSGIDGVRKLLSSFSDEGNSTLQGFDAMLGKAGQGAEALGRRFNLVVAGLQAIRGVVDQVSPLLQQGAVATGTEREFADLSDAAADLERAVGEGLRIAFGMVAGEAAEAARALAGYSAAAADAGGESESLYGKLQEGFATGLRTIATEIREMAPVSEQSFETLAGVIARSEAELARLNERLATGKSEIRTWADMMSALATGDEDAWRAKIRALETNIWTLKQLATLQKEIEISDEAKQWPAIATPVDPAQNDAILKRMENEIALQEARVAALGMSASQGSEYVSKVKFGIDIENAPTADQESRLDQLLARRRAADEALEAGKQAEARARQETSLATRREESIERAISNAVRELDVERARTDMIGKSAHETARLAEETRLLNQVRSAGREPSDEERLRIRAIAAERAEIVTRRTEMQNALDELRQYGGVAARSLENAFAQWTRGTKLNVKDMVASMLADMAQLTFKRGLVEPLFGGGGGGNDGGGLFGNILGAVLGSGGGGGGGDAGLGSWAASVFGGFREKGGPVEAGKAYVVGERRPELFVPSTNGTILPSVRGMGARGEVRVFVQASPELDARIESTAGNVVAQRAPTIAAAAVSATRQEIPGMIREAQVRNL